MASRGGGGAPGERRGGTPKKGTPSNRHLKACAHCPEGMTQKGHPKKKHPTKKRTTQHAPLPIKRAHFQFAGREENTSLEGKQNEGEIVEDLRGQSRQWARQDLSYRLVRRCFTATPEPGKEPRLKRVKEPEGVRNTERRVLGGGDFQEKIGQACKRGG